MASSSAGWLTSTSFSRIQRARHRTTADELRVSRDQLGAGVLELRQRNAEMAMLAQMARILDSSTSLDEALESIAVYCRKLLPQASGELFLYRNSRNVLEKAVHWGSPRTPCDGRSAQPLRVQKIQRNRCACRKFSAAAARA